MSTVQNPAQVLGKFILCCLYHHLSITHVDLHDPGQGVLVQNLFRLVLKQVSNFILMLPEVSSV